jgi:hypothetical protein
MVLVYCNNCNRGISVDPNLYPDGQEIETRCSFCDRINLITFKDGEVISHY